MFYSLSPHSQLVKEKTITNVLHLDKDVEPIVWCLYTLGIRKRYPMQIQEKYDSIIFLPYTCSQVFAYINNVPIVVCRLTLTQEEHQLSSFNSLLIYLWHRAKSKVFLHEPITSWSKSDSVYMAVNTIFLKEV